MDGRILPDLGSNDRIVLGYENEVGAAGFFHIGSGSRIQVHVFVKAVPMGFHDGMKAHGIV